MCAVYVWKYWLVSKCTCTSLAWHCFYHWDSNQQLWVVFHTIAHSTSSSSSSLISLSNTNFKWKWKSIGENNNKAWRTASAAWKKIDHFGIGKKRKKKKELHFCKKKEATKAHNLIFSCNNNILTLTQIPF